MLFFNEYEAYYFRNLASQKRAPVEFRRRAAMRWFTFCAIHWSQINCYSLCQVYRFGIIQSSVLTLNFKFLRILWIWNLNCHSWKQTYRLFKFQMPTDFLNLQIFHRLEDLKHWFGFKDLIGNYSKMSYKPITNVLRKEKKKKKPGSWKCLYSFSNKIPADSISVRILTLYRTMTSVEEE